LTSEKKPKKPLTKKQELTYIGIGVLIAITYTVWFIVLFGGDTSEVQITDFPIEKFNEGYNILTLESGEHLIQLSDVIDYYIDGEGYHNFATADQSTIREYHVKDGHETNSFSGYGVGGRGWEVTEVIGLDSEFPVYVVKRIYGNIFGWSILPVAYGQILPFEQQLEQIRNPQDCTRKVVQGKSATIPFSLKVFYDTTRDNKLEFKQQGTSFPVVQRTNQVMTFYTNGTDQYEIYMEMNYPDDRPRQIYIEYLSANQIVQSMQEKFDTRKFCMTLFANTILPETQLTKEQIFGESLEFIAKIPAMVVAFNANTQTSATNIAYQWILIFAILILSVLTFIGAQTAKGKFNSKMRDLDDSIVEANKMTDAMDKLVRTTNKPLTKIKEDLNTILNIPQIKDNLPKQKRQSPLKMIAKIITHKEKKQDDIEKDLMSEEEIIAIAEQKPRTESDEVLEALQPTQEVLHLPLCVRAETRH